MAALFSSLRERRLWAAAGVSTLLIYASLYFVRRPVVWLREHDLLRITVAAVFVASAAAVLLYLLRRRPGRWEWGTMALCGLAFLWVLLLVERHEERLHFLEYGVVGGFVYTALLERRRRGADPGATRPRPAWLARWPEVLAVAITGLAGLGDELIQAILPNRVYELRDAGLNLAAGAMVVASMALAARARRRDRAARADPSRATDAAPRPRRPEPPSSGREAAGSGGRGVRLLLLLLLASAFAIRAWFASGGLDYQRFFDERYTLDNVAEVLDGRFEPVWGWYPSLSYLPQVALLGGIERLHRWTGLEALKIRQGERFTAGAILSCRLLSCLYGVLGLWLLYLVGRRIFDPWTGLGAAFLLSVLPDHVRLTGQIKPDGLMLLTVLLALLLALEVYERPSWRNYLLAGAAIGLIGSAKPYGVVGALPLTAVAVVHARRAPRHLLRLGAAAATAVGLFLALNPNVRWLAEFATRNVRIYQDRGQGRLVVLGETALAPFQSHGAILGALAVAGLAWLAWRAATPSLPTRERVHSAVVVLSAAAYAALVPIVFTWAKGNLFLPLMPFTSLGASAALFAAGRTLGPRRALRGSAIAAGIVLAAAAQWRVVEWTYLSRVPSTWSRAADYLAFRLPPPLTGRLIWAEARQPMPAVRAWNKGHAMPVAADSLAAIGGDRLDRSDAEVFPLARLETVGEEFHRGRLERFPESRELVVAPRLLRVRGPALQIVLHPWQRLPHRDVTLRPLAGKPGTLVGRLPGRRQGGGRRFGSFELLVEGAVEPRLRLGQREVPLHWVRPAEEGHLWVSERFELGRAPKRIRLRCGEARSCRLVALSWKFGRPRRARG